MASFLSLSNPKEDKDGYLLRFGMDPETTDALRIELQGIIKTQLSNPLFIKSIIYSTKTEEGKPKRPVFGCWVAMYGPKEELITRMSVLIAFDEAFYDQHHAFVPEKTLILVDKKRPQDAALATSIGQKLKSYTGQEFEIQWVEFVDPLLEY